MFLTDFLSFVCVLCVRAPLIEVMTDVAETAEGQMTPDAGTPRREGEIREILDELRRHQAEEKEKVAMETERKFHEMQEERERLLYEQKREKERLLNEQKQQKLKYDEEIRLAKEEAISKIYCYCSSGGCTVGRACKCSSKACASRCGCRGNASVCQNDLTPGVKE